MLAADPRQIGQNTPDAQSRKLADVARLEALLVLQLGVVRAFALPGVNECRVSGARAVHNRASPRRNTDQVPPSISRARNRGSECV